MRLGVAALAVLLAWPAAAPGDEAPAPTRAEQWRRLRLARMTKREAPRAGWLERRILDIEKAERPSIFDLNVRGFYPRLANIAAGSELAAGVRYWKPDIKGSSWDVHGSAFYSMRKYEYYDLQVGRLPHRGRRFPPRSTRGDDVYELGDVRQGPGSHVILYGSLQYQHYPRTAFYGLGPESRREDRTTFLHQNAGYDLVAGYQIGRHLSATVRGGLLQAFVGPGDVDDDDPRTQDLFGDREAPGLLRQPDFLRGTASVLFDGRDEPGNPRRGGMLALSASRFDDRGGDAYAFHRLAADARGFLPLGSPQRVLAARAYLSRDRAAAGSRVPFYLQESLGGSHTLRGFPTYRFRGERLLLLQAEYRWEAWPALELALFGDAGKVAATEGLGESEFATDWGLALRLKTFDNLLFRLEWARSKEGSRLLARFSPAW